METWVLPIVDSESHQVYGWFTCELMFLTILAPWLLRNVTLEIPLVLLYHSYLLGFLTATCWSQRWGLTAFMGHHISMPWGSPVPVCIWLGPWLSRRVHEWESIKKKKKLILPQSGVIIFWVHGDYKRHLPYGPRLLPSLPLVQHAWPAGPASQGF